MHINIHRLMWQLDFNLIYKDLKKENANLNIEWPTWDIIE